MKRMVSVMLSAIVFLSMPVVAMVGAKEGSRGDSRVRTLLEKADLKYEVDEDGDFRLVFEWEDGRSQLVFISSATSALDGLEIREVWSVGYLSEDMMPAKIMKNLLEENAEVKLGAWQLLRMGEKDAGVFSAQIAADTDAKTLGTVLNAVSITADEKEKELMKSDDL